MCHKCITPFTHIWGHRQIWGHWPRIGVLMYRIETIFGVLCRTVSRIGVAPHMGGLHLYKVLSLESATPNMGLPRYVYKYSNAFLVHAK